MFALTKACVRAKQLFLCLHQSMCKSEQLNVRWWYVLLFFFATTTTRITFNISSHSSYLVLVQTWQFYLRKSWVYRRVREREWKGVQTCPYSCFVLISHPQFSMWSWLQMKLLKEPRWLKLKKTKIAQTRFFQCEHESKFKREFTKTCASKIARTMHAYKSVLSDVAISRQTWRWNKIFGAGNSRLAIGVFLGGFLSTWRYDYSHKFSYIWAYFKN